MAPVIQIQGIPWVRVGAAIVEPMLQHNSNQELQVGGVVSVAYS
jgi:hypothetical protein